MKSVEGVRLSQYGVMPGRCHPVGGRAHVKLVRCCNLSQVIERGNVNMTQMKCVMFLVESVESPRLASKAELIHCRAEFNCSTLLRC